MRACKEEFVLSQSHKCDLDPITHINSNNKFLEIQQNITMPCVCLLTFLRVKPQNSASLSNTVWKIYERGRRSLNGNIVIFGLILQRAA